MPLKFPERCGETTAIMSGTGNITLAGAIDSNYNSISSKLIDGDESIFTVQGATAGEWETFRSTYTAAGAIINRAGSQTIIDSSNGGAAVNFTSGVHEITIAPSGYLTEMRNGFLITNDGNGIQSMPGATWTAVNSGSLVTIEHDEDGCVSRNTITKVVKFTPKISGRYMIGGVFVFNSGVTDGSTIITSIYKNGDNHALLSRGSQSGTPWIGYGGATLVDANGTTDEFQLVVYNGTNTTVNSVNNPAYIRFWGYKVG